MRLRVSIGKRLFFAVLLSIVAVAAIGVELVRWKLSDHALPSAAHDDMDHLDELAGALSTQYRYHHDWSFLPTSLEQRKRWLRDALLDVQGDQKNGATLRSPSLVYRIGLLDDNGRYLAGAIASRAMVVVASIDRIQRPIIVDGRLAGYLVVAKSQNPDDELAVAFLIEQQRNLLILAGASVFFSVLAAALLAAHFRRPVKRLVNGTRLLGQGQFATRLSIRRSDELGELADTFNQVAMRLQDMERDRQQWVADTSHELRTPLSVLQAQMEALQDGIRTATPDTFALMLRQVQSLTKLVDELYVLARADLGSRQYNKVSMDAWLLMQDVLADYAEKFRIAALSASISAVPSRGIVHGDSERLRQVIGNLLENSARYTDAGGRIEISGAIFGQELHIMVDDSAPAVPTELLNRVGERFFRVESSRNRQFGGAGLGLALSRQIIEAHDGSLLFAASPLGGLRATIVLQLET
ncbi:ATP-binding protein [Dyella sp. 2HG41-7]|uniref:ATP-binding protein n=1 Tax=Dyella sp. 2HG41-7 TaxID=2883239 RepID=UPI001F327E3D|nr:ATP-binding protein [Dyella sp. 2HG41-7]